MSFPLKNTLRTTLTTPVAQVISFPENRERVTMANPQFSWIANVYERLNEICALPFGWDGYSGIATRFDVANFAFTLLGHICNSQTPAPSIVPMPSGGLQIEWHHPEAGDIELAIYSPNNVKAWVVGIDDDDEGEEFLLTNNFVRILPHIKNMG